MTEIQHYSNPVFSKDGSKIYAISKTPYELRCYNPETMDVEQRVDISCRENQNGTYRHMIVDTQGRLITQPNNNLVIYDQTLKQVKSITLRNPVHGSGLYQMKNSDKVIFAMRNEAMHLIETRFKKLSLIHLNRL